MQRAVLLVSHGSVDDLADLPAFVTNVRRGHPPSPELLAELYRHYETIGGRSPINATSKLLAQKTERKLGVPVAWANRLWNPYVRDVLAALEERGAEHVAVVPLAQHSAHVYADDARRAAAGMRLRVACAPSWGNDPGLCAAFAERIVDALAAVHPTDATVLMTAHSLPVAGVTRGDPYEHDVRAASEAIADLVTQRVGRRVPYKLAFQSQTPGARTPDGSAVEWLGPDLRSALDEIAAARPDGRKPGDVGSNRSVVLAPVGFLADHVETLYDLDVEARAMAEVRGLGFARARSLNADDDLVDVLARVAHSLLADA